MNVIAVVTIGWVAGVVLLAFGAVAGITWLAAYWAQRSGRGLFLVALACTPLISGCAQLGIGQPGGIAGTGIGDGEVSDTEAGWFDALRPGAGKIAQKVRPPSKPAAAQQAAIDAALAAQGLTIVYDLQFMLKEGHSVAPAQRMILGEDIESILVLPRWQVPTLPPRAITPAQLLGQASVLPVPISTNAPAAPTDDDAELDSME